MHPVEGNPGSFCHVVSFRLIGECQRRIQRSMTHELQHNARLQHVTRISYRAIAGYFSISPKTFEKHRSIAMKKLGLLCIPDPAGFVSRLFWSRADRSETAH